MEPAFIIQHYAGKVKYGVKVSVSFSLSLDRKGRPGTMATSYDPVSFFRNLCDSSFFLNICKCIINIVVPLTQDFREKNTDHMRPDIVALLKSSKNAFICGLMGIDPSAMFRWAVLRAYFRALVAFREAGKRRTQKKTGELSGSGTSSDDPRRD